MYSSGCCQLTGGGSRWGGGVWCLGGQGGGTWRLGGQEQDPKIWHSDLCILLVMNNP